MPVVSSTTNITLKSESTGIFEIAAEEAVAVVVAAVLLDDDDASLPVNAAELATLLEDADPVC